MNGADVMIKEGCLEGIEQVFGLHVIDKIPAGEIQVIPGPMLAGTCPFKIYITGKSGHGSMPQNSQDVVMATAFLI